MYQIHVPRAAQTQRDGENGAMSVYHIKPKQQRDAESGFFEGFFLQFAHSHWREGVEYAADQAFLDFAFHVFGEHGAGDIESHGGQIQLSDFLL